MSKVPVPGPLGPFKLSQPLEWYENEFGSRLGQRRARPLRTSSEAAMMAEDHCERAASRALDKTNAVA